MLAGLGTIGVASAGAGLGTTAFFSDREELGAEIEAGRLDLKLDYRSTYVPWNRTTPFDNIGTIPGMDLDEDGEDDVYVLDQVPDYRTDGEGETEAGRPIPEQEWGDRVRDISCEPGDSEWESLVDGDAGVMFELDDVKPKDEGEFTISLHHCDNRAYLWLQGERTEDADNTTHEPETTAGDTGEGAFSAGELDEYLYVEAFYDADCDNRQDSGAEIDVAVVLDSSGSMSEPDSKWEDAEDGVVQLLTLLSNIPNALITFAWNATMVADFDANSEAGATPLDAEGLTNPPNSLSTNMTDGIMMGYSELTGEPVNISVSGNQTAGSQTGAGFFQGTGGRPGAEKVLVLLGDGEPKTGTGDSEAKVRAAAETMRTGTVQSPLGGDELSFSGSTVPTVDTLYTIAYDLNSPDTSTPADALQLLRDIGYVDGSYDEAASFEAGPDAADIETTFRDIARHIKGDVLLYQGSLRGFLERTADGIPVMPTTATEFDLDPDPSMTCIPPGVNCIAVKWYLPCELVQDVDHTGLRRGFAQLDSIAVPNNGGGYLDGSLAVELVRRGLADTPDDIDVNVAQTDSTAFALRFAAVQCRHNMANENPFGTVATEEPGGGPIDDPQLG